MLVLWCLYMYDDYYTEFLPFSLGFHYLLFETGATVNDGLPLYCYDFTIIFLENDTCNAQ